MAPSSPHSGAGGEKPSWSSLGASHKIAGPQQRSRFVSHSHCKAGGCSNPLVRRQQQNWVIKPALKQSSKHYQYQQHWLQPRPWPLLPLPSQALPCPKQTFLKLLPLHELWSRRPATFYCGTEKYRTPGKGDERLRF